MPNEQAEIELKDEHQRLVTSSTQEVASVKIDESGCSQTGFEIIGKQVSITNSNQLIQTIQPRIQHSREEKQSSKINILDMFNNLASTSTQLASLAEAKKRHTSLLGSTNKTDEIEVRDASLEQLPERYMNVEFVQSREQQMQVLESAHQTIESMAKKKKVPKKFKKFK